MFPIGTERRRLRITFKISIPPNVAPRFTTGTPDAPISAAPTMTDSNSEFSPKSIVKSQHKRQRKHNRVTYCSDCAENNEFNVHTFCADYKHRNVKQNQRDPSGNTRSVVKQNRNAGNSAGQHVVRRIKRIQNSKHCTRQVRTTMQRVIASCTGLNAGSYGLNAFIDFAVFSCAFFQSFASRLPLFRAAPFAASASSTASVVIVSIIFEAPPFVNMRRQPTTNLFVFFRNFAGISLSKRHVMFIGQLPSCLTQQAVPR